MGGGDNYASGGYGTGGYGRPAASTTDQTNSSTVDQQSPPDFTPPPPPQELMDAISRLGLNTGIEGSMQYGGEQYQPAASNSGIATHQSRYPISLFPLQNPNVGQQTNFTPRGTGPGFYRGLGPGGENTDWYGYPEDPRNSRSAFFHPPFQSGGQPYKLL